MSLFLNHFRKLRSSVRETDVEYVLYAPMGELKICRVTTTANLPHLNFLEVDREGSKETMMIAISDEVIMSYPIQLRRRGAQKQIGFVAGSSFDA